MDNKSTNRILNNAIDSIVELLDHLKAENKLTSYDYKYNMDLARALKQKILNDING